MIYSDLSKLSTDSTKVETRQLAGAPRSWKHHENVDTFFVTSENFHISENMFEKAN